MYTQFLMEQMKEGDSKDEAAPEAEAKDGKVGSKRKAGKDAGKTAKRQKPTSATQVCWDTKRSVIFQMSMRAAYAVHTSAAVTLPCSSRLGCMLQQLGCTRTFTFGTAHCCWLFRYSTAYMARKVTD